MEVELLLTKMSSEISNRKDRLIFLINNFDLVVSQLGVCSPLFFVKSC